MSHLDDVDLKVLSTVVDSLLIEAQKIVETVNRGKAYKATVEEYVEYERTDEEKNIRTAYGITFRVEPV